MKNGLLIWWSNNSRAESVLARVALDSGISLGIVLSEIRFPPSSQIQNHAHVYYRDRSSTSLPEIESYAKRFAIASKCDNVILAPTSEYIMDLVTEQKSNTLIVPFYSDLEYRKLSSKSFMAKYFSQHGTLNTPLNDSSVLLSSTFIAKPKFNVVDGNVLKPFKVNDNNSRLLFNRLERNYFAQEYIEPPSFYWCAYRSKDCHITSYFQRNLLQQDNGGSIVSAELGSPPFANYIDVSLKAFLKEVNYCGPIMVELRGSERKFIELNPRFWGPLLLSMKLQNNPVVDFFNDMFDITPNLSAFQTLGDSYTVPSLMQLTNKIVNVSGKTETQHVGGLFESVVSPGVDFTQLGGHW